MKRKIWFIALIFIVLFSCCTSKEKKEARKDYQEQMSETSELLRDAKNAIKKFQKSGTIEDYEFMSSFLDDLQDCLILDMENLSEEQQEQARKQNDKIEQMKETLQQWVDDYAGKVDLKLVKLDDELIEGMHSYPMYLARGTKIVLNMETDKNITVKFYNADSKNLLKTYAQKQNIKDTIRINNTAIYLVELSPSTNQYVNMSVALLSEDVEQIKLARKKIKTEQIEGKPNDFRVRKIDGIKMTNMFLEPKKITLRSQGKAIFSGNSRSVVAVQIPNGTSDLFFSLRISTNEADIKGDGKFCENMQSSYKTIKFLGLPIYSRQGNRSSLIRELLNDNAPVREEEAYCNMYVITNPNEAKKFQDKVSASEIKYDIDRSELGTQSCNGCLSVRGLKTIYLCFENERFRYSNYLWLECIAAVPNTEYITEKYTTED